MPMQPSPIAETVRPLLPSSRRSMIESVSPDFPGDVHDQPELGPLLLLGQLVAFDRAREAALRAQARVVERHESRGLLDPIDQRLPLFQIANLARDEPEDNGLVLRDEA